MKKLLILFLLSGCMVGPNYQTPEVTVSDLWSADEQANDAAPIDKWWESFEDELLTKYIAQAADYNYDIQAAEANILKARALRTVAASKLFPHVSADINGVKTYFSKNGPIFAIGPAAGDPTDSSSTTTGLPFTIQAPQIQNLFNALFDVSWELDLFGKTRRDVESAVAELESLIEKRNDILLSTYAEVTRSYIDLRSFQRRAALLEKNIALFEKEAAIIELSVKYGYRNQMDLERVLASLSSARAAFPETQSEIYRAIYSLSILVGKQPEALVEELLDPRALPNLPANITVGLRSDLLRRRPDIRFAERKLAEATADVGVAVASFFPTISLVSVGGFQSLILPQLFEWGSRTWAYGADVNMPIFQGGQLVGNLRFSKAAEAEAAANYQQTILSALQEAESSLKKYEELTLATNEYILSVEHNQLVVTITRERYIKGLINQIDLLNNEKQLISAELSLLDSRTANLLSLVTLYKSLGGGVTCLD